MQVLPSTHMSESTGSGALSGSSTHCAEVELSSRWMHHLLLSDEPPSLAAKPSRTKLKFGQHLGCRSPTSWKSRLKCRQLQQDEEQLRLPNKLPGFLIWQYLGFIKQSRVSRVR